MQYAKPRQNLMVIQQGKYQDFCLEGRQVGHLNILVPLHDKYESQNDVGYFWFIFKL